MSTMTPAWHAERRTGIGASDAAAALGLSPWCTRYMLWLEKRGEGGRDQAEFAEAAYWGTMHEPSILRWYAEKTSRNVVIDGSLVRDDEHPFMIAHLDGDVPDLDTIVEAKSVDKDAYRYDEAWGKPGTDEVPLQYNFQCQHAMRVKKRAHADLAALVGGNEPVIYHIERDDEIIDGLIRGESEFWAHVQNGTLPPVTNLDEAKERYPKSVKEKAVYATPDVFFAAQQLAAVKASAKQFVDTVDQHELEIKAFMGDAGDLVDEATGDTLATWRSNKDGIKFDEAAFQAAHPVLYGEFVRTNPGARRFLLKVKAPE